MYLSHLQNLIDNYIKDKNINLEKKQKYIIFIMHLNRFNKQSNNNSKQGKIYLSHLSPYKQIFIDNLKGENISITKFYDLDNKKLFDNIIDTNENKKKINFFQKKKKNLKI